MNYSSLCFFQEMAHFFFFSFYTFIYFYCCSSTVQINKQQVLARLWIKGNPSVLLVGMQTGAATVENSMEFCLLYTSDAADDPEIV